MRLYLINPRNPLVSLVKKSRWSKYCVWKPLGLLILAGLTPPEWEIKIIDENLDVPDYDALPRVLRRIWRSFRRRRGLLLATVSNLSFRRNLRADPELHEKADNLFVFKFSPGELCPFDELPFFASDARLY